MPAPILTPAEIAALTRQQAAEQSFADTLAAAIPQKLAKAAEYAVTDGAFKKFFDYYNDSIIGKYDAEKRGLNGVYIPLPITEADVVGPASIDPSVRTTPSLPATDIIRIAQFDGGGTSTDVNNEQQQIANQLVVETALVSGYTPTGGFTAATAKTNSILSSGSTTLKILDPTNALTIAIGSKFVVSSGSVVAVVQVTSVTDNLGGNPPYDFTYGITFIMAPVGSIPSNSSIASFSGFTNGERTSKTATDPTLQPLLNLLVVQLQTCWFNRIARLNDQLAALGANQDPDGVAQITTATTNANASKTFLNSIFAAADISNAGLAILATDRSTRGTQITTRLGQIAANYTGQTENYYNRRYSIANDRANTARGTLRLQIATSQSVTTMTDYAASSQDAANAINALLP